MHSESENLNLSLSALVSNEVQKDRCATSWNAEVHVIIRARRAHFALRNAQYTWYYSGGLCTTVVVKHECARPGRWKAPEQSPNSGKHQLTYICLSCCGQDIAFQFLH